MTVLEKQFLRQARGWIGTPFRHQGRKKFEGVDCLGLLIGVAAELRLKDADGNLLLHADARNYGHFPNELLFYQRLTEKLKPDDSGIIALFNINGSARHVGLVANDRQYQTLIHAYAPARKVVEHRFDKTWKSRVKKCFSMYAQD